MMKKLLTITTKGLNELTNVKFVLGVLAGSGMVSIILANAVGMI